MIAVGGTVLAPGNTTRGWSESVWPRSGSGCSLYEPKPAYQTDTGCSRRTSNDVAAVAEDLSVYDTTYATGDSGPGWVTVGGTSASTPIIAAVEALSSSRSANSGPEVFYKSPGSLFDIVSGSNSSCAPGICARPVAAMTAPQATEPPTERSPMPPAARGDVGFAESGSGGRWDPGDDHGFGSPWHDGRRLWQHPATSVKIFSPTAD